MSEISITGGEALKARLAEIAAKVSRAGVLRVGFLEGATYPETGVSVPMVAAIQEFGAPKAGIPPRPYFRTMVKKESPTWGEKLAPILKANDYEVAPSLDMMGMGIESQLRQSIIDTDTPPLSPITLMLRMMRSQDQSLVVTGKVVGEAAARVAAGESATGVSIKPLVDSGHLLNSVDHEVKT